MQASMYTQPCTHTMTRNGLVANETDYQSEGKEFKSSERFGLNLYNSSVLKNTYRKEN